MVNRRDDDCNASGQQKQRTKAEADLASALRWLVLWLIDIGHNRDAPEVNENTKPLWRTIKQRNT